MLAENDAATLNNHIDTSIKALKVLAESDAVQRNDLKLLYSEAQRLVLSSPNIRAINLVDRSKNIVFLTSIPFGAPPFKANFPELLDEVFDQGKSNVSGSTVVPLHPIPLIVISVPVYQQGKISYCLRMIILSTTINELLAEKNLIANLTSTVIDRQGFILATTFDKKYIGQKTTPENLAAIQNNHGTLFTAKSPTGVVTTKIAIPIHNGDWHLIVGVPTADLLAPMYENIRHLVLALALTSGISLVLSIFFTRMLTKQLRKVTNHFDVIDTKTPARTEIWINELSHMLNNINNSRKSNQRLTEQLSQTHTDLNNVLDLYDNAPCGYHSLSAQGDIVRINQTELNWLGYTAEEVIGTKYINLFTEASKEKFMQHYPLFLKSGHVDNLEFELVRKDGSTFSVMLSSTAIKDAHGAFVMSRSTIFDLTERKNWRLTLNY